MQKTKLSRSGFTLIEVVLTLAIGGLIFLLAFLAFQQVSANRRDTSRRQDVRKILAEAVNYASNGDGTMPCKEVGVPNNYCHVGRPNETSLDIGSWTEFWQQLANEDFKNPSTNTDYFYVAYTVVNSPTLSNYFLDSTASVYDPERAS